MVRHTIDAAGLQDTLPDDPSWTVADAKVQDLAGLDEIIERLHQLGYRSGIVIPMNVKLRLLA